MLSGLAIQSISVPLGSNVGSNNGRRVFASRNLRERRPQVSLLREVGTVRNTRCVLEKIPALRSGFKSLLESGGLRNSAQQFPMSPMPKTLS